VGGQFETVSAKGVGLDDLRAGLDVFSVDLPDQCGLAQVEGVKALAERT
jgi:hypothetical protein